MFFQDKDTRETLAEELKDKSVASDAPHKTVKDLEGQEEILQEKETQELVLCKQEVARWKEQYLRARADLENFSKRVEKERGNVALFAQAEVLLDLLAVIDDFDRALEQKQGSGTQESDSWRVGIEMIRASLDKVLETYGVKPMIEYSAFNPEFHEAISQMPIEGKTAGSIVHVAQKGYLRNGVVLRAAKVVVAQ